jgi:hypothetical protein
MNYDVFVVMVVMQVATQSLHNCGRAWAAVFYPSFGKEIITGSFDKHGELVCLDVDFELLNTEFEVKLLIQWCFDVVG